MKDQKIHFTDKKVTYGIRSLKNGAGSVMIGASMLLLTLLGNTVHSDDSVTSSPSETDLPSMIAQEGKTSEDTATKPSEDIYSNPSMKAVAQNSSKTDSPQTDETLKTNSPVSSEGTKASEPSTLLKGEQDVTSTEDPIPAQSFRLHIKELPEADVTTQGLWTWGDVEKPSESWPNGAAPIKEAKTDDYGYYLDTKIKEDQPKKFNFLINNTKGENLTGDKTIELLSPSMNEAWLDKQFKIYTYQPLDENVVRINYFRTDGNYDQKSLWFWGEVIEPSSGTFPDGTDFVKTGKYGRYIDIPLKEAAKEIGFLLIDESKAGEDVKIRKEDYKFSDLKHHTQLFLRDDDPTIYTNPYYINDIRMTGATHVGKEKIEASFSTLDGAQKDEILKRTKITDSLGNVVAIKDLILDEAKKKAIYEGDFSQVDKAYIIQYDNERFTTRISWQLKDETYSYDGELGARLKNQGKSVDLTIWSPSADRVSVIVYDKENPEKVVGKVALQKGERGTWQEILTAHSNLGIEDYTGYFYQYEIERNGKTFVVLDPYAKSLAAWNSDLSKTDPSHKIAKAAFVDPTTVGPAELTYAQIPNFTKREDAIIYEAHVRDFTSDPAIDSELKHQFGTFAAFVEKLDYLKDLGVTHIQLLPVLSYYYANELKNSNRLLEYASSNSNYNWGYDPQNYFALTGMYSTDPTNPLKRIEEFKELVNEIHKRDMGVILDVVYNHTANVDIFEDIEPNYYHFMDADGTPRTSFGGGRLGTTHYMSRRVLVDSIKYLVDTYKVDGFRFDMMGDHDATSIEEAYHVGRSLNPNLIMLGEGWVTYAGDENSPEQPADQSWMKKTDTVAVFSDEIRNNLKSGYPNEGEPAFITNGKRRVESIFKDLLAQPSNFVADDPGDVIQYIAAHDNLTLFDIIAQSIKKDPSIASNNSEIHRRLRLGNLLVLTAQGTPFLHSGQEYGRTKQFRDPAYKTPVAPDKVPNKSHLLVDENGNPFDYPYFIHDSYDSSDAVNHFDWTKATDETLYPENVRSQTYTKGLIALRRSTEAFRLKSLEEVNQRVKLITIPGENGVETEDLVIGYQIHAPNGDIYAVLVNADTKARDFQFGELFTSLMNAEVLVDGERAGTQPISNPSGLHWLENGLRLDPLTATVLRFPAKEKNETSSVVEESKSSQEENKKVTSKSDKTFTLQQKQEPQMIVDKKNPTVSNDSKSSNPSKEVEQVDFTETNKDAKGMSVAVQNEPKQTPTTSMTMKKKDTLPSTGEQDSHDLALAGILGLTGLGLVTSIKKKREE